VCYILANNLGAFGHHPENLSEGEYKSNGLINLVEEFQDSIVFRKWNEYCWLVFARFTMRIWS
jgi:hypothetical protein